MKAELLGKYQVLETLGTGVSAVVKRGYDPDTDRYVALKIFKPSHIRYMLRELYAYKKIPDNPCMLELLDYEVCSNKQSPSYLVLELAEQDLLAYFNSKSVFSENLCRKFLLDVLEGIQWVHDAGFVHCDLKFENVFMCTGGRLKLGDFGFAAKRTCASGKRGTRRYMAPEQHEERPCDSVKTDLFSLGVILFTMVIGQFPFHRATTYDKIYRFIATKDFDNFWACHSKTKVSDSFKSLVEELLAYDPEERPSLSNVKESPWFASN